MRPLLLVPSSHCLKSFPIKNLGKSHLRRKEPINLVHCNILIRCKKKTILTRSFMCFPRKESSSCIIIVPGNYYYKFFLFFIFKSYYFCLYSNQFKCGIYRSNPFGTSSTQVRNFATKSHTNMSYKTKQVPDIVQTWSVVHFPIREYMHRSGLVRNETF